MKIPPYFRPPGDVVYAIRRGRDPGGPIKIGYTAKITRRYQELQAVNKQLLKFLAVIPGTMRLEKAFHFAFRKWAISDENEWFIAADHDSQLTFDIWWQRVHRDAEFQADIVARALEGRLDVGDINGDHAMPR